MTSIYVSIRLNYLSTYLYKLISILVGVLSLQYSVYGQILDIHTLDNRRRVTIVPSAASQRLDSLLCIPSSFLLRTTEGYSVADSLFRYDTLHNVIYISPFVKDTLIATFRVFPFSENISYQPIPTPLQEQKTYNYVPSYLLGDNTKDNPFDWGEGLHYNGSISRGLSIGNTQSLGLNSALNMQISGKINGLEILAVLNDNTIPLEPEGTTQQIQDFDKIYIQVKKDSSQLTAGDFDVRSYNHHFLKYSKQLQGLSFSTQYDIRDKIGIQQRISAAVAKGKFARNSFIGIEGNQGPYRLSGNNRESYIVIIAGSEKVYVDGILLIRGEDNDYTMDYNAGEITFTPRYLITKDKRITVDFEYSDRYYLRSFVQTNDKISYKNFQASINVYLEQDAKNKTLFYDLDSSAVTRLEYIGNNLSEAYISGVRKTEFTTDKALYAVKDSMIGSVYYDSIFYYSTDSTSAIYQLSFSYLGPNGGNYMPDKSSSNERVYSWVAPINGIPQGAYEPIVLLVTPKKDHYVSLQLNQQIGRYNTLFSDYTFSNKDVNTFSDRDNKQNIGHAFWVGNQWQRSIGNDSSLTITALSQYEMRTAAFRPMEQYRDVEFARDWNTTLDNKHTEHYAKQLLSFSNIKNGHIAHVKTEYLHRVNDYKGIRQSADYQWNDKNWTLFSKVSWLKAEDTVQKILFMRPSLSISKSLLKAYQLKLLAYSFAEIKRLHTQSTLQKESFAFHQNEFTASTASTASWFVLMKYTYRDDYLSDGNQYRKVTSGHTFETKGSANSLKQQNLQWSFALRKLKIKDTLLTTLENDNTYLGRIEYGVRNKKNVVRWNGIYELGSGQERAREFIFLEVPQGQGVYKWIDQNGDKIRQQDEFIVAQFLDSANYVKVLTNLNTYVPTRQVALYLNFYLQPQRSYSQDTSFVDFLKKFSISSQVDIKRKSFKGSSISPFNPFIFDVSDSNLVSSGLAIRHALQFNQGHPIYSITYLSSIVQDKIYLSNGFDVRYRNEHTLQGYYNIKRNYTFAVKSILGKNDYKSQFYSQNSYSLKVRSVEPTFSYIYKVNLKATLGYYFSGKKNLMEYGGEKSIVHKVYVEGRYAVSGNFSAEVKFAFAQVNYSGENNSTKSYVLLEGLQPDKNMVWNARFEKYIGNNLQLSLEYDGRKSMTSKAIHSGRMNLRALF